MAERITTYLLVTLRHEKPIAKIADVVACRLSMLEGVDGSGVDAQEINSLQLRECLLDVRSVSIAHVSDAEKASLIESFSGQEKSAVLEPGNPSGMTDAEINKAAPILAKGIGE